ncbi:MAG TPA: hypothetical protein VF185_02355 [Patescibacteria group bacterium]
MSVLTTKREVPTIEFLYLRDDRFKSDIRQLRNKLGITTQGAEEIVPANRILEFDRKLISSTAFNKRYTVCVRKLCKKYKLDGLEDELGIFIESGETFYQLGKENHILYIRKINPPHIGYRPFRFWKDAVTNEEIVDLVGIQVRFVVKKAITAGDLESWFSQFKEEIVVIVNDYLKEHQLGITRLNKADRAVQIIKLRDGSPKMTFQEIADFICEKNQNDSDVISGMVNEKSVKMMYYRHRIRFKKKHQ